jgi:hypothetical protein
LTTASQIQAWLGAFPSLAINGFPADGEGFADARQDAANCKAIRMVARMAQVGISDSCHIEAIEGGIQLQLALFYLGALELSRARPFL